MSNEIKTETIVNDGVAIWSIVTDGDEVRYVLIDNPAEEIKIGHWTWGKGELRDELISAMGEHLIDIIEQVVAAW